MKETDMTNPNSLGHWHRDIIRSEKSKPYYMKVTLSCGHSKEISIESWKKYKDSATLCGKCTTNNRGYKI